MLGAENRTESLSDRLPQRPVAGTVAEAVNEVERLLCGDAAVAAAAAAEGLALAGRPAAALLDLAEARSGIDPLRAPLVVHHVRGGSTAGPSGAFELVAGSAQQAVDHCLVARHAVTRLGISGCCAIDRSLAVETTLVLMPDAETLERLAALTPADSATGVAEALDAAFREVASWTGRAQAAIEPLGTDGADCVLLASGAGAPSLEQWARRLREVGISCGTVSIAQLHPFPGKAVRAALDGCRIAIVLDDERLAAATARVLGDAAGCTVHTISPASIGEEACRARFGELLGVTVPPPQEPGDAEGDALVLATVPGGAWGRRLLLDAAEWLGAFGRLRLTPADGRGAARLRIGGGPAEPPDENDLLLVSDVGVLDGTAAIESVRRQGTIMLCARLDAPDEAWARLAAVQRALIVERELRVHLLPTPVLNADSGGDPRQVRRSAALALLAADPAAVRAVSAVDAVTHGEALSRTLEAAAAWLRPVATGGRIESRVPAPERPRMPASAEVEAEEVDRWSRRVHRFHLSGEAPLFGAAPLHGAPLCPAALGPLTAAARVGACRFPGLYVDLLTEDRRRRRETSRARIERLDRRLSEMLALDESLSDDYRSPDALSATLGGGRDFVDLDALAENLPEQRGHVRIEEERRARISQALQRLRRWRDAAQERPEGHALVFDGEEPPELPPGWIVSGHRDPFRTAVGLYDGLTSELVRAHQALHVAELEIAGDYEPERHDAAIAGMSWESLEADELLLLPQVAVIVPGPKIHGLALASFSELLRCGRPIHVVVEEAGSAAVAHDPGLGYLAVAHREPFVLQSTLAAPEHLIDGLRALAGSVAPAVVLVDEPVRGPGVAGWRQLIADLHGRVLPCFHYDPASGGDWADRFSIAGNPQPEAAWPAVELDCEDPEGQPTTLAERFTFAHAAAVEPDYRAHFRVLPREAWNEEQLPVADWLDTDDASRRRAVPYLWVVDERGELARAVIDRELAFKCRDRMRAWHILQELAGTDNAYARRAAEEARAGAQAEAAEERARLQQAHAEALRNVGTAAVQEAMGRLAARLMDPDFTAADVRSVEPAAPPPAAPPPAAEEAAPAEPAPAEPPEEEELALDEPYIDTMLCTTCNECTQINPRMFQYDNNKQAFIADATAGTYEELVRAAEKCPARCIHPGVPRADDPSADDDLIARAKAFN